MTGQGYELLERMLFRWHRKRDGSIVYEMSNGSGGWLEVPPEFWPDPPPARPARPTPPERPIFASEHVRQFLRQIGRRGGLERCRNFACRTPRCWIRFGRRYRCEPKEVRARPVSASPEVRQWLRESASRGGRARAGRYPKETLRAWAAKGGHAKAAKAHAKKFFSG